MVPIFSFRILARAGRQWSANGDSRMGAALAYYALFSIAPLLLIAVQVAGAVFGEDAAKGNIHRRLDAMMGEEIAKAVEKIAEKAGEQQASGLLARMISIVLLVFTALGAFLHTRTTLCTIWKLEPPHGNTWLGLVWDYFLALVMVFSTAILLLLSLAISLAIPILQNSLSIDQRAPSWQWFEMGGSFVFLTVLFAAAYRILSGGRIAWGYVWYGSFIAAVLFTVGKTLFSYYTVYFAPASIYGAAGSIVVMLMWVYYSSQTLFFGAELIQARRTRFEWMTPQAPG